MSMQAILAASQSVVGMQVMQSVRAQTQGTANVLRIESKQDDGNEKKDEQASLLEKESAQLMGSIMKESFDVQETLRPDEVVETNADAKTAAEEANKQPRNDTIELSEGAALHMEELPSAKVVMGPPVIYNENGSIVSSTSSEKAGTFKATA